MASDNEASCVSDPNFAVICSFLECFGKSCGITYPDIASLQEMIEDVQEVKQPLIDLHIKLLRKARKTVTPEKWEKSLVKFCHTYSNQDGWELERFGYKKARIAVKLRLLKVLLESQFDLNPRFKLEVNKLAAEKLRVEPLGRDKTGLSYWFQLDEECNVRVYREDLDEENWELVASDREGVVNLINSLSDGEPAIPINEDSNSLETSEKPIIDTGQLTESSSPKEETQPETNIMNGAKPEIELTKIPNTKIPNKNDQAQKVDDTNANGEEDAEDDDEDDEEEDEEDDEEKEEDDEEVSNEDSSKQNSDEEEDDEEDDDEDDEDEENSQDPSQNQEKRRQVITSSKIVDNHVPPVVIKTKIQLTQKQTPWKPPDEITMIKISKPTTARQNPVEITPVKAIETPVITTSPLKLVNIQDLQQPLEDRNPRDDKFSVLPFQTTDSAVTLSKISIKPIDKLAANLSRIQSEKLEKPGAAKLLEKIAENLARSSGAQTALSNGDDDKLQQEIAARSLADKSSNSSATSRNQRGMDLSTSPRGWENANDHNRPMNYSGIDLSSRKIKKSSDHLPSAYRTQDFQHREMDLSTRKIGKPDVTNLSYDSRTVILRNHTMVTDLSKKPMYPGYEVASGTGNYHNTARIPPKKEDHRLPNYTILPDPSKISSIRMSGGAMKRPIEMVEDPQQERLKRIRAEGLTLRNTIEKRPGSLVGGLRREDVVGPAIEEPVMMIQGEGSGSDCDAVNPDFGEAIEEPVIFFYGSGAGRECDTGNPGDDTSSDNKESNESKKKSCSDVTTTISPKKILPGDGSDDNEASSASTAVLTKSPLKINTNFTETNDTGANDNCQSTTVSSVSPKSKFKPTLGIQVIAKSSGVIPKKSSRWDVGRPEDKNEECDSSIISNEGEDISKEKVIIDSNEIQSIDTDMSKNDEEIIVERKSESDDITSTSNQTFLVNKIDEFSSTAGGNDDAEKIQDRLECQPDSSVATDTTTAIDNEIIETPISETAHCDSSVATSSSVDDSQAVESINKGDDGEGLIASKTPLEDDSSPRFFFGPNCVSYTPKAEETLANQEASTSGNRESIENDEATKNNNNFVKNADSLNSESSDASSASNIENRLKNVEISEEKIDDTSKSEEIEMTECPVQSSTSPHASDDVDFVAASESMDISIAEPFHVEKVSETITTSVNVAECKKSSESELPEQNQSDVIKDVDVQPNEGVKMNVEPIAPKVTSESFPSSAEVTMKNETDKICEAEPSTNVTTAESKMQVETEEKNKIQDSETPNYERSFEFSSEQKSKFDYAEEISDSCDLLPGTIYDETQSCTLPESAEDNSQNFEANENKQEDHKQLEFTSDVDDKTKQSCESESENTIAKTIKNRNDNETNELCSDDAQDGFAKSFKVSEETKDNIQSSYSHTVVITQPQKLAALRDEKFGNEDLPEDSTGDSATPSLTSLIVNPSGDESSASDGENIEPSCIPTSVGPFVDEEEIPSERVSPAQIIDLNITKSPERITIDSEKASSSSRLLNTLDPYTDDLSENQSSADQDSNEAMVIDDRTSDSNGSVKDAGVVGEEKSLNFKDKITPVAVPIEKIEPDAECGPCEGIDSVPCESKLEVSVEKNKEIDEENNKDDGKVLTDSNIEEVPNLEICESDKKEDSEGIKAPEKNEEVATTLESKDTSEGLDDVQEKPDETAQSSLVPNYESSEEDDANNDNSEAKPSENDELDKNPAELNEDKVERLPKNIESKSLEVLETKTVIDDEDACEVESKLNKEQPESSCENDKEFSEFEDEENDDSREKLHIDLEEPKKNDEATDAMEADDISETFIEPDKRDKQSLEINQSAEAADETCEESRNFSDDVVSTSNETDIKQADKVEGTAEAIVVNESTITKEIPSAIDSQLKTTESENEDLEIVKKETPSDCPESSKPSEIFVETAEKEFKEHEREAESSIGETVSFKDENIVSEIDNSSSKIEENLPQEDSKIETLVDDTVREETHENAESMSKIQERHETYEKPESLSKPEERDEIHEKLESLSEIQERDEIHQEPESLCKIQDRDEIDEKSESLSKIESQDEVHEKSAPLKIIQDRDEVHETPESLSKLQNREDTHEKAESLSKIQDCEDTCEKSETLRKIQDCEDTCEKSETLRKIQDCEDTHEKPETLSKIQDCEGTHEEPETLSKMQDPEDTHKNPESLSKMENREDVDEKPESLSKIKEQNEPHEKSEILSKSHVEEKTLEEPESSCKVQDQEETLEEPETLKKIHVQEKTLEEPETLNKIHVQEKTLEEPESLSKIQDQEETHEKPEALSKIQDRDETHEKPEELSKIQDSDETHEKPKALSKIQDQEETDEKPEALSKIQDLKETHEKSEALSKIQDLKETHEKPEALSKIQDQEETHEKPEALNKIQDQEETHERPEALSKIKDQEGTHEKLESSKTQDREEIHNKPESFTKTQNQKETKKVAIDNVSIISEISSKSVKKRDESKEPEKISPVNIFPLAEVSIKTRDRTENAESSTNLRTKLLPKTQSNISTEKPKGTLLPGREEIEIIPIKTESKKEASKRLRVALDVEDFPPTKSKPPNVDFVKEDTKTNIDKKTLAVNYEKSKIDEKTIATSAETPPQIVTAFASLVSKCPTNPSSTLQPNIEKASKTKNQDTTEVISNFVKSSTSEQPIIEEKPSEVQSVDVKYVDLESDDSMGIENDCMFDTATDDVDPLACTEEELNKPPDLPIASDPKIGIRVKPVKDLFYEGWKLDSPEPPPPPVRATASRKRRNDVHESNTDDGTAKQEAADDGETVGKRMKLRGKRTPDMKLRKSVEQSRKKSASSEDEAAKAEASDDVIVIDEIGPKAAAMAKARSERKPRGRPRGKRRRGGIGGRLSRPIPAESAAPADDDPVEVEVPVKAAKPPTPAPPVEVDQADGKKKRKKRKMVLGLEIGIDIQVPGSQSAGGRDEIPVRQSRRIAQLKIKEEADKRRIEEETIDDIKEKKERDGSDKKKRRKQKPESEEEAEVVIKEVEREVKAKKKKKKKKKLSKFNEANPWQSSSGSSTEEEHQEDEDEDEIESEGSLLFKSDHEFSPESDLEKDDESEPLRRARTAQKGQSDVEEAEDEYACQKCGKADHPEWILLCDTCDKGWHCSCLRPALMLIPEGDWFCPPCQHTVLVNKLRDSLKTFDTNSKKHENEVLRKKRLAYVGISLDNVLHKTEGRGNDQSSRGSSRSDDSSSSSSESSSSSSSSEDSEPVYQLRERRCANTYKFNEYDDMINAAIQAEVDHVRGAGNQGRGKDIATIVNAEKEEAEAEALKNRQQGDDDDDETKKSGKESDEDYKLEKEEADEEDEDRNRKTIARKGLSRKKHRKLNSLDISSEDDPESDEDFKGSSSDDEEDFDDQIDSSDDSYTQSRRRGRKGEARPVRRSTRAARKTRYDEDFINDDSDDSDRPKRKKSKSVWDGSDSEDSDNSWRQRKKKSRTAPAPRFRAKSRTKITKKKKRKRIIEPDNASENEEDEAVEEKAEAEVEPEPEPKVEAETEAEAKTEVEAEAEVEAEVETPVEPEIEAEKEKSVEIGEVIPPLEANSSIDSENIAVDENHETEEHKQDNNIETPIEDDEERPKKKKKESIPKQKKGPGIRRKIIYGGLNDEGPRQEEETLARRTRGRKINYQDIMGSDSEEELKKVLRKTEESEDEFVVHEGEDPAEEAEKDSDSGDIYSPKKELPKGKAKSPKAKKPKKSKSPGGRKSLTDNGTPKERKKPGPKPGSKNRPRQSSLTLSPIGKTKDSDSLTRGMDMEGSTMSATGSVIGEVPEGSLTGLTPEDINALDDDDLEQMMMEDEEYGRRQLELAAIEIARKKQEEREAKKLEKARLKALEILAAEQQQQQQQQNQQRDPNAPEGTDGEVPKKKKRGRRSKAEILAEQMRRDGVSSILPASLLPTIVTDTTTQLVTNVDPIILSPNITPNPKLPTVIQPIETETSPETQIPIIPLPDNGQLFSPDGSPIKPKRRGRGKGKKTLALEAARAAEAAAKAAGDIGVINAIGITGTETNPDVKTDDIPNVLPTPGSSTSGSAPPTPPASVITNQGLPVTLSPNQQPQPQSQQQSSVYPALPPSQQSSVITRMLQSQPVSTAPQSFTAAAAAMGHKYFGAPTTGGQMMPGPRPTNYEMPPRGRIPSPYRQPGQPSPMPPHFAAVRSGTPPMRMRLPGAQLYHTPHHPMDPSPSGGGPISINSRDRSSPLGPVSSGPGAAMIPPAAGSPLSKGGPTPPPPPYVRGGSALGRFSDNPQLNPRHQLPPFTTPATANHNMQQPSPPPNRAPGNFSPYHPPPPPNYHYGAYPPPPPMTTADDAAAYQGSPYSAEHFSTPADSQPQIQQPQPPPQPQPGGQQGHANESSGSAGNKQYDEEGTGEFGGLVSYFSSQREDDLDS